MSTKSVNISYNGTANIRVQNHKLKYTYEGGGGGSIPTDTDFLYFANDFTDTSIPNKAQNSMSDYLKYGTLVKNGSGKDCYLTNDYSDSNYLYYYLDSDTLNKMKLYSGTDYTYFCRVYSPSDTDTGGVLSWRSEGGYIYMIRTHRNKLQIHFSTGADTIDLVDGNVIKINFHNDDGKITATVTDLDNGNTDTVEFNGSLSMSTKMTTFNAGFDSENYLQKFYGIAGIGRATTSSEDEFFRKALHNQSV